VALHPAFTQVSVAFNGLPDWYAPFFEEQSLPYTPAEMAILLGGAAVLNPQWSGVFFECIALYTAYDIDNPPEEYADPPADIFEDAPTTPEALPDKPAWLWTSEADQFFYTAPQGPLRSYGRSYNQQQSDSFIRWALGATQRGILSAGSDAMFGTPVELVNGKAELEEDCDGAILMITAYPARLAAYAYSSAVTLVRHMGTLAFAIGSVLDERQKVELTQAIYVPRNLGLCTGVVVSCTPGVEGSVTTYKLGVDA